MPLKPLETPRPWDAARQPLECVGIREETADVRTFTFRAGPGTIFRYRPGQFVTLQIPAPGGPLHRSYTLASSPSRPFAISVTVKAQAGSSGTQWMFDNITPGSTIRALGPMGTFFLPDPPGGEPLLLLSAGSGITPMLSMLRWCQDMAPMTDIVFVQCARTETDLMFLDELALMAKTMPRLGVVSVVARGTVEAPFLSGRMDMRLLAMAAPDFAERRVFCCGPDGFMAAMREGLVAGGFDPERYAQESFGATELTPAPLTEGGFPIRFSVSGAEALGDPSRTILEVARGAGVAIPSACGMGICGTCRVRANGPVEMEHQGGIFDDEIAEGYILACCSRPQGEVEVEA
jgi:ferredoxin-NADP reductase